MQMRMLVLLAVVAFFVPQESRQLSPVLMLHGLGGSSADWAPEFTEVFGKVRAVVRPDLPCRGASNCDAAQATPQAYIDAATEACLDVLRATGMRPIIVGRSLGAFLAAVVAERCDAQSLVLITPANYPDHSLNTPISVLVSAGQYQALKEWRSLSLEKSATRAQRSLERYRGDVLILSAHSDAVTPSQTSHNFCRAARCVFSELSGGHELGPSVMQELTQKVATWVDAR